MYHVLGAPGWATQRMPERLNKDCSLEKERSMTSSSMMELSMRSLPAQLCLTHALLHSTLRTSAEILRFTLAHESLALAEARPEAPGFTICNTVASVQA